MSLDLSQFLAVLTHAAQVIKQLAIAVAMNVVGVFYLGSALVRTLKWSDQRRNYGVPSIAGRAFSGTALIQASDTINTAVLTFTGALPDQNNAMSVMPSSAGGTVAGMVFGAALAWLATLGAIAILHGIHLIVKAGDGGQNSSVPDPGWTGCVFIVSGAIGINMWRFVGGLL